MYRTGAQNYKENHKMTCLINQMMTLARLLSSRFSCLRCGLRARFGEFMVYQGKYGRKLRSDWQKTKNFLHNSNKQASITFFSVWYHFFISLSLLIIFTDILQL